VSKFLSPDTRFDAIVIGGGCVGTSILYNLARAGLKVALLERYYLGAGTTGRSSAIIRAHYTVPELARMAQYSLDVFSNFADIVGGDPNFVRTGYVVLVGDEQADTLTRNVAMQRSCGVNTSVLSRDDLQALLPAARLDGVSAASYEPDAGYADGGATCEAYAAAAQRIGAEVNLGIAVHDISVSTGHPVTVNTSAGVLTAEKVAVAAGNWGAALVRNLGTPLEVSWRREAVCAFRRPWAPPVAGVDLVSGKGHWRPDSRVVTLWGAETVPASETEVADPDAFRRSASDAEQDEYQAALAERFPFAENAVRLGGWGGVDDVTPDWMPYLGPHPDAPDVHCAFGMSSHFFKHCPVVGRAIADMMTEGRTDAMDISLFRPSRFLEGEPIRSPDPYLATGTMRDIAGHGAYPSL
jgi:glycine/D-amino acid oxidase-like deaminating enzyme